MRENRPEAITRTTPPEVMTLAEAATFLRLEEPVLEASAEAGELPAASIGGQWRFSKTALLQWLASPKPHPAAAP